MQFLHASRKTLVVGAFSAFSAFAVIATGSYTIFSDIVALNRQVTSIGTNQTAAEKKSKELKGDISTLRIELGQFKNFFDESTKELNGTISNGFNKIGERVAKIEGRLNSAKADIKQLKQHPLVGEFYLKPPPTSWASGEVKKLTPKNPRFDYLPPQIRKFIQLEVAKQLEKIRQK